MQFTVKHFLVWTLWIGLFFTLLAVSGGPQDILMTTPRVAYNVTFGLYQADFYELPKVMDAEVGPFSFLLYMIASILGVVIGASVWYLAFYVLVYLPGCSLGYFKTSEEGSQS